MFKRSSRVADAHARLRILDRFLNVRAEVGLAAEYFTLLEYIRANYRRDGIVALLGLTSHQVQTAIDFVQEMKPA